MDGDGVDSKILLVSRVTSVVVRGDPRPYLPHKSCGCPE